MKHIVGSWLLMVCFLSPAFSQSRLAKHLYVEQNLSVRGGFYTMAGVGFNIGWHLSPAFAVGMGAEWVRYHEDGVIFTGQIRGYGPTPGWNRLYYSLKAGVGPLIFDHPPRSPKDDGNIVLGEIEVGFRINRWLTLATGYTGWKHRVTYRSFFMGGVRENPTFREEHTLSVKGIFTVDPYGKEVHSSGKVYGYALLSLYGQGIVSYPNFDRRRVLDQAGYVGIGYNLSKKWGIGLGFSGVANTWPTHYYNKRRLQGLGIQTIFAPKWLVAMGEIGYAVNVEDVYQQGLYGYGFRPRAQQFNYYYRGSLGIRFKKHFLLMGSVLATPVMSGRESYSFYSSESSTIELAAQEAQKSFLSWQIGVGYLMGK